ncbi:hypothetical protein K505DRAFT_339368 [Melanomma pulvis-pyrius CBS 109.77]|uniref:Uncharacterized protein n=1 Tax=Melanomma pulvis-pyrius CBS 109.77 TaxID=1314802 RepID=A0A6A6X575_9PLEO|nr:hypothetical protein K505DRAFT_339368 [Melanomma pulvis-pyrius CBS 109.77]
MCSRPNVQQKECVADRIQGTGPKFNIKPFKLSRTCREMAKKLARWVEWILLPPDVAGWPFLGSISHITPSCCFTVVPSTITTILIPILQAISRGFSGRSTVQGIDDGTTDAETDELFASHIEEEEALLERIVALQDEADATDEGRLYDLVFETIQSSDRAGILQRGSKRTRGTFDQHQKPRFMPDKRNDRQERQLQNT